MQTTPTPTTAPTAKEAAEFLRQVISKLEPLHKGTMKVVREFFDEYFDDEWTNYHYERWASRKKNGGGVPGWICNLDTPRTKLLLKGMFGHRVVYPKVAITQELRDWNDVNNVGDSDEELEEIERTMNPIGYAHYAWQQVVLHKFSVYCLNNCDNNRVVGKKKYNCRNWGWAAWFMAITEMEQEEFSQLIITSR